LTPLALPLRAAHAAAHATPHANPHAAPHAAPPTAPHPAAPTLAHALVDTAAHTQVLAPAGGWLVAALAPLLCLLPVLWRVATGTPQDRLVAQNLAQLLAALTLLLSAQGFDRPSYQDLALLLAVLAPAGTLVYARFLGGTPSAPAVRWAALIGVPLTVVPLCVAAGPGRELLKLLAIGGLLIAGCLVTSSGSRRSAEPGAGGLSTGGPDPGAPGTAGPGAAGEGEGGR
jgi:multisubunit Na+/H+ antiporter MnhF subunit